MRKKVFFLDAAVICLLWVGIVSAADVKPAFSVQDGNLQAKWENQELNLSLDCPIFLFKGAAEVQAKPMKTDMAKLSEGKLIKINYPPVDLEDGGKLQVIGCWQWHPKENVLRQWARYRVDMPILPVAYNFSEARGEPTEKSVATITLMDITLNHIPAAGMLHIALQPQSVPALGRGLFAGIEYPVANTRIEGDRFILAQRPGKILTPGKQYETRKVVYGFTPVGDELRNFHTYIMSNRPNLPSGMHISYCSWWSAPRTYAEEDMLKILRAFKTDLYEPHGATFDSFTIDAGWSDMNSIWGISKERFPQEFDNMDKSLDAIKSHLGLWLSPSSCYPFTLDNAWAKAQGYETYFIRWTPESGRLYACMGGPKYAKAYKDAMTTMVNEKGTRYFKLDGFYLTCPSSEHGHEPGLYSSEVIVENALETFDACRIKHPNTWLALYNMGNNASPWWLSHLSTVQGCWGDESPPGRIPNPVPRENYTTGRDYHNLQGLAWGTLPPAGQDIIGLIHQSDEPFLNDAMMVAGRGNTFYAVYLNPIYMNDRRWEQLSGLFDWLRANGEVLSQTEPIFPASWQGGKVPRFEYEALFPREPYGYTHWAGKRGLVMLRNPWVSKQTVRLDLSKQPRITPGLAGKSWSIVSLYPEVRGYEKNLTEESVVEIPLAPYETLVLSIASDHNLNGVKPYSDFINNSVKVSDVKVSLKPVVFEELPETAGPDWTALPGKSVKNTYELNLSGKIENSQGQAELLVLFESPRQKEPSPIPFDGKFMVNGKEVPLADVFSDSTWKSTGMPDLESWTYVRGKLAAGKSDFSLQIVSPTSDTKVSCWAWTYKSGDNIKTTYPNALPSPESIYLDSTMVLPETTVANAVGEPELRKRKVEKINGMYLDTLEATSSTQSIVANQSVVNKPLVIAGKTYERGIGTFADGQILYDIEGKGFKRFIASVGVDTFGLWISSMDFSVWVDGVKRWESGLMRLDTPAKEVNVDISGAKQLELRIGDGGNGIEWDLADFGNAKLLKD